MCFGNSSIERWLVPVKTKDPKTELSLLNKLRAMKPHQFSTRYLKNNYVFVLWLAAFLLTNIALFISRAVVFQLEYGDKATIFLVLAKSAGKLMCSNSIYSSSYPNTASRVHLFIFHRPVS